MYWCDSIKLISITTTENEVGDIIEVETSKEVLANKKSIRQTEFYQAAATGLKPELMFEMWTIEYNQEPRLEYNSKEYNIIRTYDKDGEMIELICQGVVNGVM